MDKLDLTYEIYLMLSLRPGYVSGEAMGERLGISRAAVGKHIQRLKDMGFDISSSPRSGHMLTGDKDIYNGYTVRRALERAGVKIPVLFLENTASTNTYAKQTAVPAPEFLVVAREQTGGRGRKNRAFESAAGGLYSSYVCVPSELSPYDGIKAVLAAGCAVAAALENAGADGVGLKWPNDVLIGGKKVSGILCEMVSSSDRVEKLVLGTGINVSNKLPQNLSEIAASLEQLGCDVQPSALLADYVVQLRQRLKLLCAGEFSAVLQEYRSRCITVGRNVKVTEGGKELAGIASGVDDDGFLRVVTAEGEERVISGDVWTVSRDGEE